MTFDSVLKDVKGKFRSRTLQLMRKQPVKTLAEVAVGVVKNLASLPPTENVVVPVEAECYAVATRDEQAW